MAIGRPVYRSKVRDVTASDALPWWGPYGSGDRVHLRAAQRKPVPQELWVADQAYHHQDHSECKVASGDEAEKPRQPLRALGRLRHRPFLAAPDFGDGCWHSLGSTWLGLRENAGALLCFPACRPAIGGRGAFVAHVDRVVFGHVN